jgi:hypothetical protein
VTVSRLVIEAVGMVSRMPIPCDGVTLVSRFWSFPSSIAFPVIWRSLRPLWIPGWNLSPAIVEK